MFVLRPRWIFVLCFLLGGLTLVKKQGYYGLILHGSDAQYYYATAHSLAFDRDLDVTNNLELTPWASPFDRDGDGVFENVARRADGGIQSRFPIGMSLVEVPLLWTGAGLRAGLAAIGTVSARPPGYSDVEVWTVALGLALCFAIGFAFAYRLLLDDVGPRYAAPAVAAAWFGTSLFFYSMVFPFMTHAVGFVLTVGLLYQVRALRQRSELNRVIAAMAVTIAAMFLVRPQQITIALFLLPLFVSAVRCKPPARWLPGTAAGAVTMAGAIVLQAAVNWRQVGTFSVNGYAAEGMGFSWLAPAVGGFLFSGHDGFVIFGPVAVIGLAGILLFYSHIPEYLKPFILHSVLQAYIIASWVPGQGDTFGPRMWSENALVVAFGLAVLIKHSSGAWRPAALVAIAGCVAWTNVLLLRYVGVF